MLFFSAWICIHNFRKMTVKHFKSVSSQSIFNLVQHFFIVIAAFYTSECSGIKMTEIYAGNKSIVQSAHFEYFGKITQLISFSHCFRTKMNFFKSLFNRLLSCTSQGVLSKLQRFLTGHF